MGNWQKARAARDRIAAFPEYVVDGVAWRLDQWLGIRRRRLAKRLSRAQALHQQDRLDEAEAAYRHLLATAPTYFGALLGLGVLLVQRLNYPEAIERISQALEIWPGNATAWYQLGDVLSRSDRYEEAVACYDEAARLRPDDAKSWKDRGAALRWCNRLPEALDSYDRALQLDSDYLEAHIGRSTVLHYLKRVPEAVAGYDRALLIEPGVGSVHLDRAMCLLVLGDLEGGWPGFEMRELPLPALRNRSLGLGAPWRGEEPLAGKSILLWAEPGFGDTIQFCRFAKMVAAKGARVLLLLLDAREATSLQPLMERLEGTAHILRIDEQAPATDYHCSLESLPWALSITLDNLPAERQYLYADEARVAAWDARLGPRRLPRIGLVWSGNPARRNDRYRSMSLQDCVQLVKGPFEFICLQKDVREADQALLEQRPDIRRFDDDLQDFGDTAALLQHLDLVITVDTSVAHLAGALGRPVWIVLAFVADWRWLLDRDDCPWYPTARLFRQPAPGDWTSVVAAVADELAGRR